MKTNLLNKINVVTACLGSLASIHGFVENRKNKSLVEELNSARESLNIISVELGAASNDSSLSKKRLDTVSDYNNKMIELLSKVKNSMSDNDVNVNSTIKKSLEDLNTVTREIEDVISGKGSGSGVGSSTSQLLDSYFNTLNSIYGEFTNYLAKLSGEQLAAISNLFLLLMLIICIINIVLIAYGEFLINYFEINIKYPKLNKIIKYRRVIQKFNLYFYSIFGFIAITILILFNLYVLLG